VLTCVGEGGREAVQVHCMQEMRDLLSSGSSFENLQNATLK